MRYLIVVGLLPKMKMRRHRMLEKMDQEISREQEDEHAAGVAEENRRMVRLQLHGFRKHFDERRRQHESGAQRDEILQKAMRPLAAGDQETTQQIRPSRRNAQQQRDKNASYVWKMHRRMGRRQDANQADG